MFGVSKKFDEMMTSIVIDMTIALISNFKDLRLESTIFTIGEILRCLISNKVKL